MQTWDQDEKTGDYKMNGGAPVETNSLRAPAYVRLKTQRQRWLYAPDSAYGSDFHLLKRRQTNIDISLVENTAARALQPIVEDGRAARIDIEFDALARDSVGIKCRIIEANGRVEQFNLPGLGV